MIPLPLQPKIIQEEKDKAVFEIEALYPGYGVTVGNALRRVLLSSLPGTAVTKVKIKGAQHEFTAMPGILEDAIMIMLNLKQLRFKIYADEPQKATLKIKGEKDVKGSDFDLPSQVELVNKDVHIATITDKKTELEMEITIGKGFGFVPRESQEKSSALQGEKLEIGVIPIDAIFTPIRSVSFKVDNMRVGKRTDFDRLMLEIKTDGTITPEDAFTQASEILLEHFSFFTGAFKKSAEPKKAEAKKAEEKTKESKGDAAEVKVEDLKISKRTLSALTNNNIKTVSGILRKNEKSLLELEGMGDKGIKEIKKALKKLGLELKET